MWLTSQAEPSGETVGGRTARANLTANGSAARAKLAAIASETAARPLSQMIIV